MKKGKYLFIDIGAGETKIVEAIVKKYSVAVLKTAEMRDMSLFVSERGIIRQIEGFCKSLKQTLEDSDISTKSVVLCSSILGISSKEITSEFKSVKDCIAGFEKTYGRTSNFSLIYDWQYMGDVVSPNEIQQKLYLYSGAVDLLKSLISSLRSVAGLNVISVEPTSTAISNLHFLYQPSYDMPSLCLVDLGRDSAYCVVYKNDALVNTSEVSSSIFNIAQELSERYEIPLPKMRNILYNIGAVISEKNKADLAASSISPDSYYAYIHESCKSFSKDLQRHLTSLATSKRLENVRVIFCGGFAAMPGVAELLQKYYTFTPCDVLEVDSTYICKNFRIINKTNHAVNPKFSTCLGLTLKNLNAQHVINLVPKELLVVDSGKVIKSTITVFTILAAATAAVAIGLNVTNVLKWIDLLKESSNSSDVMSRYTQVLTERDRLADYVSNLKSINSSLTPFIEFLNKCENKELKIASVDTPNVLEVTVQTGSDTDMLVSTPANTEALDGLIIRGYALSSEAITDFYESLVNQENISSVNMNGIREITLGSLKDTTEDIIYIFELEVDIHD